jgi:hypothetical protein
MSKSNNTQNRNFVAAEMKQKSRTIGGRLDRRVDSNRNRFDWRFDLSEANEIESEIDYLAE